MRDLSNHDIDRVLRKTSPVRDIYLGAFPVDRLPDLHLNNFPVMLVVNTDPHNLPGRHWISIFIDGDRQGEVFDPLASPLSNHVMRFMNRWTRRWMTNHNMYQHPRSHACGVFVLYHLLNRLCYPSLTALLQTLSPNPMENEIIMSAFYRRHQ